MNPDMREDLEREYRESTDPWEYTASPFEAEKYTRTLASLPREHYGNALEIACSIGVFTAQLASRVDDVLGVDLIPTAIELARQNCGHLPNVRLQVFDLVGDELHERFDLIVCGEVLYYIDPWQRARVARKMAGWLRPGGDLVLVHHRRRHTRHWGGYARGGAEQLHRLFTTLLALPLVVEVKTADYIITVVRAGTPVYPRWRRMLEALRFLPPTIYPLARLTVRTWVRRNPALLSLVRRVRHASRTRLRLR